MNNKASHALYSATAEPSPEHEALCAVCRVPPIIWAKTGPTSNTHWLVNVHTVGASLPESVYGFATLNAQAQACASDLLC